MDGSGRVVSWECWQISSDITASFPQRPMVRRLCSREMVPEDHIDTPCGVGVVMAWWPEEVGALWWMAAGFVVYADVEADAA